MHIIDGFWCRFNSRGMKRFVSSYSKAYNVRILEPTFPIIKSKLLTYILYVFWEQLLFQCMSIVQRASVIVYAYNTPPILKISKAKCYLVVHDVIFFNVDKSDVSWSAKALNFYRRSALRFGLKNVDSFIFVSNTTRLRFEEIFGSVKCWSIIPNRIEKRDILEKLSNGKKKRDAVALEILVITGTSRNKNLNYLYKVAEICEKELPGLMFKVVGVNSISHQIKAKNVIFYSNISDEEKNELLVNSDLLLFPSIEEGFGIPLIEAGLAKTLILCSDIPVFREICGEHAIYINPTDIDDCFKKISYLTGTKQSSLWEISHSKSIDKFHKICLEYYAL